MDALCEIRVPRRACQCECSVNELLDDEEKNQIDGYDTIFEKYSLYCNGRWMGAQVLTGETMFRNSGVLMAEYVYSRRYEVLTQGWSCTGSTLQAVSRTPRNVIDGR